MARYHVRADGSMGICTAKEGNCPFGGEVGTRHFDNKADAEAYAEGVIKYNKRQENSLKKMERFPFGDPSKMWVGKTLNEAITSRLDDDRYVEVMKDYDIDDAINEVQQGPKGEWDDISAHTPEESKDLNAQAKLAVLLHKYPSGVRERASQVALHSGDPKTVDNLISQFYGISENVDDWTGKMARGVQAELAWIRDGQPYYPEWEAQHKDEVYYGDKPALDFAPFGDDVETEDEILDKTDEIEYAMDDLEGVLQSADDLNEWSEEKDFSRKQDEIEEYDGYLTQQLEGTIEIQNPHYWDHEPDKNKAELGRKIQEAYKLLDRSVDDHEAVYDRLTEWYGAHPDVAQLRYDEDRMDDDDYWG